MPEVGLGDGSGLLYSIAIVLVTPRDATNVGAVVRVMGNFGLLHLRLVEPAAFDEGRVLAVAHRGAAVVEAITRYPSLQHAVADCGLVIGTSARGRAVRYERLAPWQAASTVLAAAAGGARVALVFGPEDNGLSNGDLAQCHAVSVIPTARGDWSLNLAQAALVHLYELWLAAHGSLHSEGAEQDIPRPDGRRATLPHTLPSGAENEGLAMGAGREEMFSALTDMIWSMHHNNDPGRVESTVARLRAVLLRSAPRTDETRLLTTLFQHIAHALRRLPNPGPPPPAD